MDSQDRDKSKFDRRREPLAVRISEALNEMDSRNAGDCPDGEILATYMERGLGLDETAKWESHFATCSRCRRILLVLDASVKTPLAEKEVAQLGEVAVAMPAGAERARPASSGRARPWLADWRLRWLAPAMGVAAVLAVMFVLRPTRRAADLARIETLVAQAPKQESPSLVVPPESDRISRAAPSPQEMQQAVPRANEEASSTEAKKKSSAVQGKLEAQAPSAFASSSNSPSPQAGMPAPAAPPPPAKAAANTATPEAAQLDTGANAIGNAASLQERQAATAPAELAPNAAGAAPRPQISSEARLDERKEMFALARPLQKASSAVLKAPSGSVLWRAGTGGRIERSTDGGSTWVLQASPLQQDWLAGAAVSDTVCWLAGRQGSLARTVDGEHWELIAPPSGAAGAKAALPDWTSVTAVDSQTATISASDGRIFATTDGGKTWRRP